MATPPRHTDLSLQALELFQTCARTGSVKATAAETGLAASTISHHVQRLEAQLGTPLFDHGRRPLVLTAAGMRFLRRIEGGLQAIRQAEAEVSLGDDGAGRFLRLGAIEDFDSDIIPELAVHLSHQMPGGEFLYHTDSSHALIDLLRNNRLDLALTTQPGDSRADLTVLPLLRDPFVLILPKGTDLDPRQVLAGDSPLPFLRFSTDLMIARQIEAQLRRLGHHLPRRFECSNDRTLMAMVAAGAGWSVTTPLLYARSRRFHDGLDMCAFPGKGFARTLAVVTTPECPSQVALQVVAQTRDLITRHALGPVHQAAPWLERSFRLID